MEILMLLQKLQKKLSYYQDGRLQSLYEKEFTNIIQKLSMFDCSNKIRQISRKFLGTIQSIFKTYKKQTAYQTQNEIEICFD